MRWARSPSRKEASGGEIHRQIIREGAGIDAPKLKRILAVALDGASVDILASLPERATL